MAIVTPVTLCDNLTREPSYDVGIMSNTARSHCQGENRLDALRELLGRPGPYEPPSTMELLKVTPLGALEETVKALKQLRPAEEVREAMVERIAQAPAGDFDTLKYIYLKHCGDAAK